MNETIADKSRLDEIADRATTPSESLEDLRAALARKAGVEAEMAEFEWHRVKASKDEARIYSFLNPIVQETIYDCMEALGQWHREDPERPIQIVLNSPGGAVIQGLALYDYIHELREQGAKIDIAVLGLAASMAGIVMQAGETRVMGKHAYLMIHEVSGSAEGNMSVIKDTAKFTEQLQGRLLDILASRSSMDRDEIERKWERKDWWLNAEEAVELGFADEIR